MKKFFLWSIMIVSAFVVFPPAAVTILVMLFIYYAAGTPKSQPLAFIYPGGISYPRTSQPSHEPRAKDYNDYQIEDFLAKRKDQKTAALENTGLSLDEEIAIEDLEKRLNED